MVAMSDKLRTFVRKALHNRLKEENAILREALKEAHAQLEEADNYNAKFFESIETTIENEHLLNQLEYLRQSKERYRKRLYNIEVLEKYT